MSDQSAPLTPEKWRARIRRSLELQKVRRDEAERFKRAYTGDYSIKPKKNLDENKDEIAVNFVFEYVETVRPTLVPGTPRAFVEAENADSEGAAPHYQGVINHFIRTLGFKNKIKEVVEDLFYSYAGMLTEWDYTEEPIFDEEDNPVSKLDANGQPIMDERGKPVQDFKITRDRPLVKRLHPDDIILDPDSRSQEDDLWRAYRMILTKAQFNALPGITPEMRKKIRPKMLPRELQRVDDRNSSDEKNWVILYRIYDLESESTYLLSDGESVDFFVEDKPWPFEFEVGGDRFPITVLEAKRDPGNPYSFGIFKAIWTQIQERNKLRTMLQSNTRRNAPGWMGKKGVMDEAQKTKFADAKIGEYNETNGDPRLITVRPTPQLNGEFFAHDERVSADVDRTSSLSEFRADINAATATEASIQNAKANIRKGEGKAQLNDFCAIIFGKMGQLSQQFLTVPVAIKIKNPTDPNQLSWLQADKNHIQGEFHLAVKPGNDDTQNEDLYRQQTLKGAEVLANNPWVDQKKMAIKIARVFEWEAEDILKTEQQFQQEQAAAQAAAEAEQKKSEKPPLDFSAIKLELLPPQIQAMVIAEAMKQNGVQAGGGISLPGTPAPGSSPSLAPPPPENSVMPGADINQAPPPMPGAGMPPGTPVQPNSEMQGGLT